MNRILIILTLLVISSSLWAVDDSSLSYTPSYQIQNLQDKMRLADSINKNFPVARVSAKSLKQPFFMDTIHSSELSDQVIMMKYGYDINDEKFFNQVKTWEKGFIYHSKTSVGAPYALYFEGFTKPQVENFLQDVKVSFVEKKSSFKFLPWLSDLVITAAHAEDCDPGVSGFIPDWLKHAGKQASSCLIGAFRGAWDSTGGAVAGIGHVILHPIKSAQAVWSGASKFWSGMKAFTADVKAGLKKLSAGYEAMPEGAFTELTCRVVSALGTAALVSYFTLGAGAPGVMLKITQILDSIGAGAILKMGAAAKTILTPVANLSSQLAKSKSVIFIKSNFKVKMTAESLTPGKSYTALIYKDKLVIGEDIQSLDGTLATAGSHVRLMETLKAWDTRGYRDFGGAIKIHPNGTIDVAGYHLGKASKAGAANLAAKIKEIMPDAVIRTSEGKLGGMPELAE